ncbi:MAG: cysteine hydrolase family protein [Sphingobium sp.]
MAIAAKPFDYPYDGRLDPARTALLVIDMQNNYLAPDGYFARRGYDPAPLRAIVPMLARLVDATRAAGCRIVWTRQGNRADLADASPYDLWRAARAGIVFDGEGDAAALLRGTPGFDIVDELRPAPDDIIVDKTANGAFCQTDLDMVLRTQGITHLLFSGITTDVCVHTTLREAVDRKYQCLTVTDCCASGDAYAHEAAIHMITVEDGIFGTIATVDAVIGGLGSTHAG